MNIDIDFDKWLIILCAIEKTRTIKTHKQRLKRICDPASQNQQKVAWPSFVLWLEIGDQGQHG